MSTRAITTRASSSAISGASAVCRWTAWPSWSPRITAGRCTARSPAPACLALRASTGGRCGVPSRALPARSTSTSGPGRWSASTGRSRGSGLLISPACSARRSAMTDHPELPGRARVVIIGGGVIGASVAYHLAELGWTDVLLLEQGQLSCGTTWHAAGLVGQLRATESGTRLVQYSTELYERLEAQTGQATGFRRCGGVTVARTPERMAALARTAATAAAYEIDCELISPKRAHELYPIMNF